MTLFASAGRALACTAVVVTVMSPAALRAEQPLMRVPTVKSLRAASRVADVSLDARGTLHGQALTQQGNALVNCEVLLDDGVNQRIALTDEHGSFRFGKVRSGAYRVQVEEELQFCRAWKYGTAPPAATRGLLFVEGEPAPAEPSGVAQASYTSDAGCCDVACGDAVGCGSPVRSGAASGARRMLHNPLVVGGVIAAAVAIPVAVQSSSDDDPGDPVAGS